MQPAILVVAPDQRERVEWASLLALCGFTVREADSLDVGAGMASVARVDAILIGASCGLAETAPRAMLRCVRDVIRALVHHCRTSPRFGTVVPVVFAQPAAEPATIRLRPASSVAA